MENLISTLNDPEECQKMAEIFSELAVKARRRSVELRAQKHGKLKSVELELLKVLYAYEDILTLKNNRKTHAARTWQMVKRYGIIRTAEKAVNRPVEPMGYKLLADRGMKDLTFEAVISKYPREFSHDIVKLAKNRLEELENKLEPTMRSTKGETFAQNEDEIILRGGTWDQMEKEGNKHAIRMGFKTRFTPSIIKAHIKYRLIKDVDYLGSKKITEKGIF